MKKVEINISNWDEFKEHIKKFNPEELIVEKALERFKFKYKYKFSQM